ncbi:hypothetical protein DEU56DRAFT_750249 [Suillus clintonianus]|uniref:uncharacterized protein n=1 Tax=Suillus clintonianus TaxID=1904413 RepID=UPI001B86F964|nr:uncharacterized protein DEU56DRAFT_750249 [Suillus clintonianus]KAG2157048.1 hypothetical protein DEU56DRAFT_750249 [Suillus clintonianus]
MFHLLSGGLTTFKFSNKGKLQIKDHTTKEDLAYPAEFNSEGQYCFILVPPRPCLEKEAEQFGRWGKICNPVKLKDAQLSKALHIYKIKSFSSKTVCKIVARHQYPNTAAKLKALSDTGKILLPLEYLDSATIPAGTPQC